MSKEKITKTNLVFHLRDVIDKLERSWPKEGFYDDYDGYDGNGEHPWRNTADLLASLKQIHKDIIDEFVVIG